MLRTHTGWEDTFSVHLKYIGGESIMKEIDDERKIFLGMNFMNESLSLYLSPCV